MVGGGLPDELAVRSSVARCRVVADAAISRVARIRGASEGSVVDQQVSSANIIPYPGALLGQLDCYDVVGAVRVGSALQQHRSYVLDRGEVKAANSGQLAVEYAELYIFGAERVSVGPEGCSGCSLSG